MFAIRWSCDPLSGNRSHRLRRFLLGDSLGALQAAVTLLANVRYVEVERHLLVTTCERVQKPAKLFGAFAVQVQINRGSGDDQTQGILRYHGRAGYHETE